MSVVMSYKYSNCREIFFDHSRIHFNVVLMCKSRIKYQYVGRAVCAYVHIFMPPTLKKLEGHIAFGLSVCLCVCASVCVLTFEW